MDIDREVTEKSQRSEGEVEDIEGEVTDEFQLHNECCIFFGFPMAENVQ